MLIPSVTALATEKEEEANPVAKTQRRALRRDEGSLSFIKMKWMYGGGYRVYGGRGNDLLGDESLYGKSHYTPKFEASR